MQKKKLTVVLIVLAVVLVFAVLVFSGVIKLPKRAAIVETQSGIAAQNEPAPDSENDYAAAASSSADSELPYLATTVDGIYYTAGADGKVAFFKYASGVFSPVKATGTYHITVSLSESDVSCDVAYYKDGDRVTGVGVYTASSESYVTEPYGFFQLMNFGSGDESADSDGLVLLVDTTSADLYYQTKTYEEQFIYYPSDNETYRILSEANRTVGLDGAKRKDYAVVTTEMIENAGAHYLFLSGRHYMEDEPTWDLMRSGGSGNNVDNIRIGEHVVGFYGGYNAGKNIRFLGVNDAQGVSLYEYRVSADEVNEIAKLEGAAPDRVLVCGHWAYAGGLVVDILTGEQKKLDLPEGCDADMFACDGVSAALRGYVNGLPVLVTFNLKDGSLTTNLSHADLANGVNMHYMTTGQLMVTIAKDKGYTAYQFG